MTTYNYEWFEKKEFFEQYLDIISYDIQVINKSLLNKDYDKVREYVGYVENTIERERKTMEEYPELKSQEIEKFLEESLNEAKAALRRCPKRDTISNTTWSDKYYKEESYQEKKARWDYEESQREYRNMQWKQQQPWFNH